MRIDYIKWVRELPEVGGSVMQLARDADKAFKDAREAEELLMEAVSLWWKPSEIREAKKAALPATEKPDDNPSGS